MSEISTQQQDCLFCRIVAGEIPATVVKEGERVLDALGEGGACKGHQDGRGAKGFGQ